MVNGREYLCLRRKKQFWVPPGFGHEFLVPSDVANFKYKCSDYYDPSDEASLCWNDTYLNIDWLTKRPLLSTKDANPVLFSDLNL